MFVRLNDDHAKTNVDLFTSILKMMNEYRELVKSYCIWWEFSALDTAKYYDSIHIKQLDNTHEIAGLIYSNNLKVHLDMIGEMINMRPAWKYKSLKSCLQFEEYLNNNHSNMIGRQKLYCKVPLHLLQTESITSSVSMGIKPLLMPSTTFYRNLQQT